MCIRDSRGIMSLMLASARSMPDFHAAAISFSYVSDEILAQKEAICPTRVPMRDIARFVRDKARELERSLPPPPVEQKATAPAKAVQAELEEAPASEL